MLCQYHKLNIKNIILCSPEYDDLEIGTPVELINNWYSEGNNYDASSIGDIINQLEVFITT